ncbi:alpha-1,2-fucosyltransferase [Priestia megaterium]
MKIVQISSGLGNQLFQYALYKRLSQQSDNVFLDKHTSYLLNKNQHNGYELERVFNINPRIATHEHIRKLSDLNNSLISRMRRKIFFKKHSMYIEPQEFAFHDTVFTREKIYIKGYWQNYEYFTGIEKELKKDLIFQENLDEKNKLLVNKIINENSVSIHVRRGDYYSNEKYEEKFGNIATPEYYLKAIKLIEEKVENPIFYIFSDDIEWAKMNLGITGNVTYVTHNKGIDSYKDMQLMSLCRHNIIANSSFSWWGAFLNKNSEKIVICPRKWINIKGVNKINIFPELWISI